MSALENKKLMQEIFAAAGNPDSAARDRALFIATLADDATWTVTGQYSWSRTFKGRESILNDLHGHVRSRLADRTRTLAHRFIADGDHVVHGHRPLRGQRARAQRDRRQYRVSHHADLLRQPL